MLSGWRLAPVSPVSIAHNYHDAYFSEWNFQIQQQLGKTYAVTVSYVGSKGTMDLNLERNYNQFINGLRPYPTLSAKQPHRSWQASHQHPGL